MPFNYAERFEREIEAQYARELTSADFSTNRKYRFIDAQTIKMATLNVSGYKDHNRDGSKNRGTLQNDWIPYRLTFDRNVEFYVDELDVDETNQVLSAANVTATFNTDEAIPEMDSYRYSKLFADLTALGGDIDTTALTAANILQVFDARMQAMDEAGVPTSGRRMKVTPSVNTMLKNAEGIARQMQVNNGSNQSIDRIVKLLDEVQIDIVPSIRLKTAYDFTEGTVPAASAKQINFILYHNSAIIAPEKIKDIYLWPKGSTPDSAFGWLYQNRAHHDCFVVNKKAEGVAMNVEA
jgi:hypothetical protein